MNNITALRVAGNNDWQRLSTAPLVLSGVFVFGGTTGQIRISGGSAVIMPAGVALPFHSVDLSTVEFFGATSSVTMTVLAGTW